MRRFFESRGPLLTGLKREIKIQNSSTENLHLEKGRTKYGAYKMHEENGLKRMMTLRKSSVGTLQIYSILPVLLKIKWRMR